MISPYLKAYVALVGSIATGLLGTFTADTPFGQVLTVVAIVATAVGTFAVPNAPTSPRRSDPGDGGYTTGEVVLLLLAVVAVVLLGLFFVGVLPARNP